MLKVGELFASVHLDDKDFNRGVDRSEGKFRGLVGGVAKGGLVIAGALAGVGVAGGLLGLKLGGMASDLNESISKVKVVFGDMAGGIQEWSKGSAASLGMSQQAALEATGTYGNLFRAMGIGVKESAGMSTGLVELSADLASFNNMDPTEVLDKLRAGLSGETEPLRTLGVNLTAARIEAKAMEMGLMDANGELSAAAKAQATYALILKDTTLAQGDFARTADGMANQQRTLKATLDDTMTSLGQAVIPIIESLLPMLISGLQGVADWATENGPAIQETISGVFTTIGDTVVWFIENAWPLLLSAFTFFVEEVVPPLVGAIMWLVEEVIPALAGQVQSTAEGVMPMLAAAFSFIAEEIIPILAAAFTWIAENVLPVLVAVFQAVHGWIVENWPTISSIIGQVAGAISTAFGFIAGVIEAVWPIIEAIASVLFPLVGAAATILLGALETAFNAIGGVFEVVGGTARHIFNGIKSVWRGLSGFFGDVWGNVGDVFKGGINYVIGLANGMIGFLNNLRVDIPRVNIPGTDIGVGGGSIDPFNIGKIPYLARGARNFAGGLAVVGEQGPELVQLSAGSNVFPHGEGPGMGGVNVNMTVQTREAVDAYDIGIEARRAVRLGLRRRAFGGSGA